MSEVTTVGQAANKVGEAVRSEVERFLYLEARLLGTAQERVWLNEMVHPDITYRVSSRQMRSSKDKRYSQANEVFHFDDDLAALDKRVAQTESGLQWRSDPAETLIYFISNIEVFEDDNSGDLRVYSNVLMIRDRRVYESDQFHYRRDDVLRRSADGGLRLYSRNVVYGQRFVQGKNLLFFL